MDDLAINYSEISEYVFFSGEVQLEINVSDISETSSYFKCHLSLENMGQTRVFK